MVSLNTEHIIGDVLQSVLPESTSSSFECSQFMDYPWALSDLSCHRGGGAGAIFGLNECQTRLQLKEMHEEYQFRFLSYV